MKPTVILIHLALAATLLAPLPAQPDTVAHGSEAHIAAGDRTHSRAARFDAAEAALQRRLATPEAARVFRQYNAAGSQKIQHHLAVIYGSNPEYARDAGGGRRPLADNIVGPVTLQWLTQFCRDYGIVAGEPGFERAVVDSLEQVAGIAKAYPDWLRILGSPDFEAWINEQPNGQRVQNLKMRRSGASSQVNALIEQYLRERRAGPAAHAPPVPLELTHSYDPKRPTRIENLDLIAARLKPMIGRAPSEEEQFEDDVRALLYDTVLTDDTLALIKRFSQVDGYLIDADLLRRMRREGLPEAAVTAIQEKMQDVEYIGTLDFQDALTEVAAVSPDAEAIEHKRLGIVRKARQARFAVPETLAASLGADAPLGPAVAAVFAGFQGIEYPTRELFDHALEWQVRRALNMCTDPRQPAQGALDDEQFAALAAMMSEHADKFARITELRAVQSGCSVEQLVEADALAYQAHLYISPRLDRKMDLDRRHAMPNPAPRTSAWAAGWCGCGRPERNGLIYGFFPLWLDAGERQIDFGSLSRIGLYGLTVDPRGGLQGPTGMEGTTVPHHLAAMMRAAHQHDVKVDWVIARSDWSGWSNATRTARQAVLTALLANIVSLLERDLPGGGQTMTRLGSLGLDAGATGGDGVALYFRDFPAADKELFNEFVLTLSGRLKAMTPARRLSLMADYEDVGKPGPFDYNNLIRLIERTNPIPAGTSFAGSGKQMLGDMPVMVLVPEPTSDTKRALRNSLHDALRGADSVRLLWALLPVLEYDGTGSRQLASDIVYVSADYHGIGFWPLAFAGPDDHVGESAADTLSVNRLLALYYQPVGDLSASVMQGFDILCPHRLWLRWVFWGSLLLAIGVGAVYFNCRGCNERFDNSGLYFAGMLMLLALPLVSLSVLVVSDPLLEPYSQVALAAYGTGGIVVAVLVARYYFNKSRRKLP